MNIQPISNSPRFDASANSQLPEESAAAVPYSNKGKRYKNKAMLHAGALPAKKVAVSVLDFSRPSALGGSGATDAIVLKQIILHPGLTELGLNFTKITDDALRSISTLALLQTLDLSSCHEVSDVGFGQLGVMSELRKLILSSTSIGCSAMEQFSPLINLESLYLTSCEHVDDSALKHVGNLLNLRNLFLSSCRKITGVGLTHLRLLRNLQRLKLHYCWDVTDIGLRALGELVKLEELDLGNC